MTRFKSSFYLHRPHTKNMESQPRIEITVCLPMFWHSYLNWKPKVDHVQGFDELMIFLSKDEYPFCRSWLECTLHRIVQSFFKPESILHLVTVGWKISKAIQVFSFFYSILVNCEARTIISMENFWKLQLPRHRRQFIKFCIKAWLIQERLPTPSLFFFQ